MDLERFTQIVEAYGGNPTRWPSAERETALVLLKTSTVAHQLQQEALALDTLLDKVQVPHLKSTLKEGILTSVRSQQTDVWQWLKGWLWGTTVTQHLWRPAIALGLPLIMGLGFSILVAQQQIQYLTISEATQNAFYDLLSAKQQPSPEWLQWL